MQVLSKKKNENFFKKIRKKQVREKTKWLQKINIYSITFWEPTSAVCNVLSMMSRNKPDFFYEKMMVDSGNEFFPAFLPIVITELFADKLRCQTSIDFGREDSLKLL